MDDTEKADALSEALAILDFLQTLLSDTKQDVTINADGLYMLLGCVVEKLRIAAM